MILAKDPAKNLISIACSAGSLIFSIPSPGGAKRNPGLSSQRLLLQAQAFQTACSKLRIADVFADQSAIAVRGNSCTTVGD